MLRELAKTNEDVMCDMFANYVLIQNFALPGLPELEAFFHQRASKELERKGEKILKKEKKFGIDAMISLAKQRTLEAESTKSAIYGLDLTKGAKSKEEILNIKNRLNNIFLNIPALIRKEMFKDNPIEFINAYTSGDINKLTELNKIGLVSDTQLTNVKNYNNKILEEQREANQRKSFIEKLESMKEGLYETFKNTGNININSIQNNSINNTNVQDSIQ